MLWIYLLVLQILFFFGLLYFLSTVLKRNLSKATGHLQELSKDYVSKEEEAAQLLQNAQKESKVIVAKEKQAAEETKEKLIKEAQDLREKILKDAQKKASEISERAQRNAEFLQSEFEQKIDDRARQMVFDLFLETVPKEILKDIHAHWVAEAEKGPLDFSHLKLPDDVKEVRVQTAFAFSEELKKELQDKLNRQLKKEVGLMMEIDPQLVVGFIITLGSVVVDASLRNKILKAMRKS